MNLWLKAEAWSNGRISARATPRIRRAVFMLVVLGVIAMLFPWGASVDGLSGAGGSAAEITEE